MSGTYDPSNVAKFYGKTFKVGNERHFGLTEDGEFTGMPSLQGAKIMLIAGVEPELFYEITTCFDMFKPELKTKLDNLIYKHGKKPAEGLHLVVSLTPRSVQEKNRYGMITSPIQSIE